MSQNLTQNSLSKVEFTVKTEQEFKNQETFDTHTISIVNQSGTISDDITDVNKEQTASLYVGATKLTDIIVMNDIPGLTEQYQLSIDNNILIGVPDNFSSALGNPNKLYVWFSSNDYSIFVYNPKNNQYMRLGSSISVDSENVNSDSNPINFVESAEDIADPSKYEPKTWVYYPQP